MMILDIQLLPSFLLSGLITGFNNHMSSALFSPVFAIFFWLLVLTLVNFQGISVSQINTNMFPLSYSLFSPFITLYRIVDRSNTIYDVGVVMPLVWSRHAYPSGAPDFNPVFKCYVAQSVLFCLCVCVCACVCCFGVQLPVLRLNMFVPIDHQKR